jgi:hypothetical protein
MPQCRSRSSPISKKERPPHGSRFLGPLTASLTAPCGTGFPEATARAVHGARCRIEHPRLNRPPDLLHDRQGAFHGFRLDLADMLFDKLENAAQKMPQKYEFDPGHTNGIR